jgi:transposase
MSQSLMYHVFGVRGGYEYHRTGYQGGGVQFHLKVKDEVICCPQCQGVDWVRKGRRHRQIRSLPIGLKPVTLVVEVPRLGCSECGENFEFSPPLPTPMSNTLVV